MDELICRQDALKALDEMSYKSPHESATSVVRKKHFGEILEKFIMQQPSAQRKGHWININEGKWNVWAVFKCSECGEIDNRIYETDNFCPNCGADMRKEEE